MKNFFTRNKRKGLIVIAGVLILVPFAYAANQTTLSAVGTTTLATLAAITKNNPNFIFPNKVAEEPKEIIEVKFIQKEKAKVGIVESLTDNNNSFVLDVDGKEITIEISATTTVYSGEAEELTVSDVTFGKKVYVFGYIKSDESMMMATKIVIANKSKLKRPDQQGFF